MLKRWTLGNITTSKGLGDDIAMVKNPDGQALGNGAP